MSSSMCQPSSKLSWVKKMNAKIAHEERLWQAALKVAEGGKVNIELPTIKNEKQKPANVKLFENLLEDAKVERKRRLEKETKKKQQQKEESKA